MVRACQFVAYESLLAFAPDSGGCIASSLDAEDVENPFADLLHGVLGSPFFFASPGFRNQEPGGEHRKRL